MEKINDNKIINEILICINNLFCGDGELETIMINQCEDQSIDVVQCIYKIIKKEEFRQYAIVILGNLCINNKNIRNRLIRDYGIITYIEQNQKQFDEMLDDFLWLINILSIDLNDEKAIEMFICLIKPLDNILYC